MGSPGIHRRCGLNPLASRLEGFVLNNLISGAAAIPVNEGSVH